MIMQSTVSPIVRLHPAWRYLVPIQSKSQLLMFAAIVASGLAIVTAAAVHMNPAPPLALTLSFVLIGASIPLYALLPARMDVTAVLGATDMFDLLHQHVVATGYVQTSAGESIRCYGSGGPRWQRWPESRMSLCIRDSSTIRVEGAKLALKEIRRWLEHVQREAAAAVQRSG
jgi:hypothetical protein